MECFSSNSAPDVPSRSLHSALRSSACRAAAISASKLQDSVPELCVQKVAERLLATSPSLSGLICDHQVLLRWFIGADFGHSIMNIYRCLRHLAMSLEPVTPRALPALLPRRHPA